MSVVTAFFGYCNYRTRDPNAGSGHISSTTATITRLLQLQLPLETFMPVVVTIDVSLITVIIKLKRWVAAPTTANITRDTYVGISRVSSTTVTRT